MDDVIKMRQGPERTLLTAPTFRMQTEGWELTKLKEDLKKKKKQQRKKWTGEIENKAKLKFSRKI